MSSDTVATRRIIASRLAAFGSASETVVPDGSVAVFGRPAGRSEGCSVAPLATIGRVGDSWVMTGPNALRTQNSDEERPDCSTNRWFANYFNAFRPKCLRALSCTVGL